MAERRLRVGVVGTGALGRHHVRILASLAGAELAGIYDQRPEVAAALADEHGTLSCGSFEEVLDRAEAVVLAVPTYAHASLGRVVLERGLHLLVEKPMTSTLDEADELLALAAAKGKVLAVGHVEFYNPAVQALLAVGGQARFVEVQRLSPFTPRSLDVDVILDLMIHDLQILHALDASEVVEVRATGIEVLSPRVDIANARIELASGAVANLTASRVSAEPTRRLRVFQGSRYISIDYRQQEIKGLGLHGTEERRVIEPMSFAVERREPLQAELAAFVAACQGEAVPHVDGRQGRRALATALAVTEAVRRRRPGAAPSHPPSLPPGLPPLPSA